MESTAIKATLQSEDCEDRTLEATRSNSVGEAISANTITTTGAVSPSQSSFMPENDSKDSSTDMSAPTLCSAHLHLSRDDPSMSAANASSDDGRISENEYFPSLTASSSTKKQSPGERLQRSRERNRIHARKTRQRKKEQMQNLQSRAEALKADQVRLKQSINEKTTASILVGLFSKSGASETRVDDPRIEELLRRPMEQIPDASKLPELPALILPGQHKKSKSSELLSTTREFPNDGIDYELLGKDRSKCTPEELDQIRRERNRMHAKRTRDRKRLFMEEMADMCKRLEDENGLLQEHLDGLNGVPPGSTMKSQSYPSPVSPSPSLPPTPAEPISSEILKSDVFEVDPKVAVSEHGVTFDQIKTLLEAAGAFSANSEISFGHSSQSITSDTRSVSDCDDGSACKRRRLNHTMMDSSVPQSIQATATATVGC